MTPLEIAMGKRDAALLKGDKAALEVIEAELIIADLATELRHELVQALIRDLERRAAILNQALHRE
jgi:signal recognition particle GTPase